MNVVIISGFFNPLHGGHLDMIEAAADMGDKLVVIVNNDVQQVMKKDKIILNQENRARLLSAIKHVDEVMIAIDQDPSVIQSLAVIADGHSKDTLIFANGGDRDSEKAILEADICNLKNIEMVFGVGGNEKADSSTRINQAMGHDR